MEMNKKCFIVLLSFFILSCSSRITRMKLGSNIYDDLYIQIKGNTITFPIEFNYILEDLPELFDYENILVGKIDFDKKIINCNDNMILIEIFIYTKDTLSIGYKGQIFNFVSIKE